MNKRITNEGHVHFTRRVISENKFNNLSQKDWKETNEQSKLTRGITGLSISTNSEGEDKMINKRITDEELTQIKNKVESNVMFGGDMARMIDEDVPKLLAEIELLRADERGCVSNDSEYITYASPKSEEWEKGHAAGVKFTLEFLGITEDGVNKFR